MSEIKYSAILNQIVEYAKTLGEDYVFTAERFTVAIIDLLEDKFSVDGYKYSHRCIIRDMLCNKKRMRIMKGYLKSKIRYKEDREDYIDKCLNTAWEIAKINKATELTPELLLKVILENPNHSILRAKCKESSVAEIIITPQKSDLETAVDNLFASYTSDKIFSMLRVAFSDSSLTDSCLESYDNNRNIYNRFQEILQLYGETEVVSYCDVKIDVLHNLMKNELEELKEKKELEDFQEDMETTLQETFGSQEDQSSSGSILTNESENCESDDFDVLFEADFDDQDCLDDEIPEIEEVNTKEIVARLTKYVKSLRQSLSEVVFGQDNAINIFTQGYFQSELLAHTDKTKIKPTTFLFAGPPGVGKTFLAETAARILELPFARFDMSEYSDKEANLEFCGSDKVYKNGKSGNFTSFVSKNSKCVVLFDEIEKAHSCIIHLFLQILDAGRIRDNYTDEEISLKDTILIFTTNAGKPFYENSESGDFSSVPRKIILNALQKDVKPDTQTPYFPAAICSRFASGNVVMFNNISVHNLLKIGKREILRHAENIEHWLNINFDIDERVYSALLYSEGSNVDARTIKSRAGTFFDDELFELFRLLEQSDGCNIESLENIEIGMDIQSSQAEILELFENTQKPNVLVFSDKKTCTKCRRSGANCAFLGTDNPKKAIDYIKNKDINIILVDVYPTDISESSFLNIEDVASAGRNFLRLCLDLYSDIPIYVIESSACIFKEEEKVSLIRQGIRGFLNINKKKEFSENIEEICDSINRQAIMKQLAKSNKIVKYETSQSVSSDGKNAKISLFDLKLMMTVDSEDSGTIIENLSKPNVRFDQVIGAEDAKQELQFFVGYLKNQKKYRGVGLKAPKGLLLYGPPGTGKTMLAKAMAAESDVAFITAEGNQFLKQYVGEGAEKVHELFRTARKYAPSILFIDEIDAIAKERQGIDSSTDSVLTAFLTEMDGFKNDFTRPVFVLAATNFDVKPGTAKSLDPALMRRFDRRVYIDLPNRSDRSQYIKMKVFNNQSFDISDEKIENIAMRSTGMSLADLESVLELSLRSAIRIGTMKVTDEILDESFETFNNGEKKDWDISQLERVARHESGHAFLSYMSGSVPSYITIVARGDHGGYVHNTNNEGKEIYTKDELLSLIRTSLGGRAAEIVYYGSENGISTGASGDLRSATRMAENLICSYGMYESIGLGYISSEMISYGPLAIEIRNAVNKILAEEMQKAVELLTENRSTLDKLVKALLEKNHLSGTEIRKLLGRS